MSSPGRPEVEIFRRLGGAGVARLFHALCFPVSCVASLDGCRIELYADFVRRCDLGEPVPGALRLDMVSGGGALVFDLDVADLRGPAGGCGCVGRKSVCGGCWPLVARHAGVVTRTLRGLGLGPLHWWFSGGHGVHGFVFSAAASAMSTQARAGLVRILGKAGATVDGQVTTGTNRKIRAPWSAFATEDAERAFVGLYLGQAPGGPLWEDLGALHDASDARRLMGDLGALRRNVEAFLGVAKDTS